HNGFLEEVAKFRAARKIWATIMKDRFGVSNEKALYCRFHVQTGGSTLTATQIDNNIVRTSIQALSAVLGGTQSLHTNSKDEALALPTNESARLALRTQQIIAHESGITQYPDPFGGSYVVEEMTDNLINDAMKIISEIDDLGGTVAAIEQGWIQNEITRSAYTYQKEIDSKARIIVGVNQFEEQDEFEPEILEIDSKKVESQIESVKSLKISRNNDQVSQRLSELKLAAQSAENVIPPIIDCVKNECTLGEIADTLRDVFGIH
ncbi:MAG: methylmalonyl-CoA mutase, partial [Candidatus Marinimicrobia bacterium]|nr:methylmalonyl-CoA mutase [Candidatus Neomarinimicrobiota bacterium]